MAKSPAKRTLKAWRRFAREVKHLVDEGATPELLAEHRRGRTRNDPALFALVYLSKHLVDRGTGAVSLADIHVAWADAARSWMTPNTEPMADRRAEVAPREMGKSTWWFLLLPLWAAAHGHVKFAAAFAHTGTQAETHLASLKSELDTNPLIRHDYPDLCTPKTRGRGTTEADRVSLYHAKSGFVFAAAGMDSANLGLKVGSQRPDLIVLDDIEPHEGKYSEGLATKRLDTLISAILPLNIYAHVILAGTVTMQGSIVHQIVKHGRGEVDETNDWVGEQRIGMRHTLPIVLDDDGKRRSIWPAKWPLAFLESIEHTAAYAKNYANDPLGAAGDYWALEDIERARILGTVPGITRVLVSLDPAVTTKKSSDYSAIGVVAWSPSTNKCTVLEVRQVRKTGADLRRDLLETVGRHNAGLILVETNQGGDLWKTILWGMPIKVKSVHQSDPKEVRAADVLNHYQRNRVGHAEDADLRDYEGQLVAFPNAPHDDMVDAVGSAVRYFLNRDRKRRTEVGGSNVGYVA